MKEQRRDGRLLAVLYRRMSDCMESFMRWPCDVDRESRMRWFVRVMIGLKGRGVWCMVRVRS